MFIYLCVSLILSTSFIFCSESLPNPLVRRDSYPPYSQLMYSKNTKPNIETWAAKLNSSQLGTVYIAFKAEKRIFEPDSSTLFHELERAYHLQPEHKDEKE